ncbi:class I SAM-dependent methyltransferase [Desulfovibrio sp. JY]|nr:class I SAM-dependent methyltransferase [Desulfovibrio sp. JY]
MSVGDPYRLMALGYDPATALFLDPIRRLVCDTATRLGARRVLDVCCGTGRQTLALRRAGLRALGVDASPAMLAVARKAAGNNAPFARMDARRLAFADATFDAACITLALHENAEPDRLAMVREMMRVTRPGGSLLLVDYTAATTGGMAGLLVPLAERLAGGEHYRNYRDFVLRKGVAGLCRRLGLAPAEPVAPCLLGRAALLVAQV